MLLFPSLLDQRSTTVKARDGTKLKMRAGNIEAKTQTRIRLSTESKIETLNQSRAQRGSSRRQDLRGGSGVTSVPGEGEC